MRTPPIVPLLIAMVLVSCGDGKEPAGPGSTDGPASFQVAVPESVHAGQPFSITVTAVARNGATPDGGFSGAVQLSASSGSISPATLTVTGGVGTGEVTLQGDGGQVSVTVRSGSATGSAATLLVGTGPVARLEIRPSTLLLTDAGETRQMTAVGYDAAGQPTAVDVVWSSTDPGTIAISADGTATAASALGSSLITASAQGVTSVPVLAVVAEPVAGAVLVADEQVVGGPVPISHPDDYGPGWRYRITLTDMASPAVGTLLIASGGAAVVGRVVSVAASGDDLVVTLELVPVPELFERLVIDESIPLDDVPVTLAAGMDQHYRLHTVAGGATRFLPRSPDVAWRPAGMEVAAEGVEFNLGPFGCTATGGLPQLDLPQPKLEVKTRLTFHLVYGDVFEKLSLEGEVDAEFGYRPVFKAVFEGKVSCDKVIGKVVIPVSGFATWAFSAIVPIGIGMDLDAKLTVAEVGFDVGATAGATMELGIACPGGGACGAITELETRPITPTFQFIAPAGTDQLRIELGVYGYALARLSLGSPLSESLQFQAIEAKAGVKQSIDLMTAHAQARNPAYGSDFKLVTKIGIGPGKDLKKALKAVGDLMGVKLDFSIDLLPDLAPLAESPKGTFTIEPATVQPGDSTQQGELATFTVNLDPVTYLGIRSVDKVEFFWRKDVEGAEGEFTLENGRPACSSIDASPGQTTFTCQTDFLEEHAGEQTFHAFVHARLFGVPIAIPFEVGIDSKASVHVDADLCGTPPAHAVAFTEDNTSSDDSNLSSGTRTIDGPNFSYSAISGGASSTSTSNFAWSPSVDLYGESRDWIRLVPLVPTSAEYLVAQVHVNGSAMATADGNLFDATARITVAARYFGELHVEASLSRGATDTATFDQLVEDWYWPSSWYSVIMEVGGRVRHRGTGSTARISADMAITFLEVTDPEGEPVPVVICSVAGVNYGAAATAAAAGAGGTGMVASRPVRQVGAVPPAARH
jgi:hypothetical protein